MDLSMVAFMALVFTLSLMTFIVFKGVACANERFVKEDELLESAFQPVEVFHGLSLLDVGHYTVSYKLDAGEYRTLGFGWSGDDTISGAVFKAAGSIGGKHSVYLSVPWKRGTGDLYLDYRLKLPDDLYMNLDVSVALSPYTASKSDGIEFMVFVNGEEMLKIQKIGADWATAVVDLADHRGQVIDLRLVVTPGARRDPSFDTTLLGNPRLISYGRYAENGEGVELEPGSEKSQVEEVLEKLHGYRRRFGKEPEMQHMINAPELGVCPSVLYPDEFRNAVLQDGDTFVFSYIGPDGQLEYVIEPTDDWPAHVGWRYLDVSGRVLKDVQTLNNAGLILPDGMIGKTTLENIVFEDQTLKLVHRVSCGPRDEVHVITRLFIKGKCLGVEVQQIVEQGPGQGCFTGVRFGKIDMLKMRRNISLPYLPLTSEIFLDMESELFVAGHLDWSVSNASEIASSTEARYNSLVKPNSSAGNGTRRLLKERFYLVVSPHLEEVLPNTPNEPSRFMEELSNRVVADVWADTFEANLRTLLELAGYGVRDLAIIYHNWQHKGYDNAYPEVLPANPHLGGDRDLVRLVEEVANTGSLFALHENYVMLHPNTSVFDWNYVMLDGAGRYKESFFHEGLQLKSYELTLEQGHAFAREFSPEVHRRYGTSAGFLDVSSAEPMWLHVDYNKDNPNSGFMRVVWEKNKELFEILRQAHGGPLFGEGGGWMSNFYYAGLVDGVEAELKIASPDSAPWWVDFNLLKIHPQMVNHGMGYFERWIENGYDIPEWWNHVPPQWQLDKYRAMELAFGHSGFIARQIWQIAYENPVPALQEYYLMRPIQSKYNTSIPKAVRYQVDGVWVDISDAMRLGMEVPSRLYVTYESGLEIWVNASDNEWWELDERDSIWNPSDRQIRVLGDKPIDLPPYGFVARTEDLLVYTATRPTRDGFSEVIVDFALTGRGLYVNSRHGGYVDHKDPQYRYRLNLEKESVDFGVAVTEGSFFLQVEKTYQEGDFFGAELILYPIPREEIFSIEINLELLMSNLVTVQSEEISKWYPAEVTMTDLRGKEKPVAFKWDEGIFSFVHERPNADYYTVKMVR